MTKYTWRTAILESGMILGTLVFCMPFYILVTTALKKPNDPGGPLALPSPPTLANFPDAWVRGELGSAILNSVIVTVISVTLIVILSALASYPLARVTRAWSRLTYILIAGGLILPFQLAMLPLYQTMRDLSLLGTPWSLVLFYVGTQMPFSVILYTGFLREIPVVYEEAASIDGANQLGTFVRVLFPMLRPVTGTVIILNVVTVWNDFLTPLLYLYGSNQETIPVALFQFVGQYVSEWNVVFAGLIITILPILILYFLMQKTVIKGFSGGLKG
ncbi:carbohydrate ABC transporter permease [Demequina aurantiaca]|uniref:carbohydrate ABC transporter permease n=1 Tax=Demequina aurantiaca TaxID=676200 RepID=UPI0007821E9A|nr:carbohydrate ABC transporter permease [Demequina aurantiaca]